MTLNSLKGKLILLNGIIAVGMLAYQHGVDYGDHVAVAALCTELVLLASGDITETGTRLVALIGLLATGFLGSMCGVESGELIAVATMVVMADIVRR